MGKFYHFLREKKFNTKDERKDTMVHKGLLDKEFTEEYTLATSLGAGMPGRLLGAFYSRGFQSTPSGN